MKSSHLMIFSVICAFMLLVSVVPETEALKELVELMDDKKLKKKVMKRLIYYFMVAGNKKIYTVPFPLPLPIPILKKLQPIIYKEHQPVPVPVPYEVPVPAYPQHDYGHGGY